MLEDVTLERQFGKEVGGFFQGVLEEHGIEVHGGQKLEKVVTKLGMELEGDCVVVGVGVISDVSLAKAVGLELGEVGGVKCLVTFEILVLGIYVVGDICEYDSSVYGRPMWIEYWDVT